MEFTPFYMHDKIYLFEFMTDHLIDWYNQVSRAFRNHFKWTPNDIGKIKFKDIVRIYNELVEDVEEQNRQNK